MKNCYHQVLKKSKNIITLNKCISKTGEKESILNRYKG